MEQERGVSADVARVDLAAAAGSPKVAWTIAAIVGVATFLAGFAVGVRLFGVGAVAVVPAFVALWLMSWWRVNRMVAATDALERQSAMGVLRVRVRSGSSVWWVGEGTNTELVVSGGWVVLGDRRWPAAAVTLGREPNFWSARPIELLTPTGPVGVSVVPKGDVGTYLCTIVDRRVRPLLGRVLAAQPLG